MKRVSAAALCAVLLTTTSAARAAEKPLRLEMIDMEGGAATLFVTPEGRSVLIDTGWPPGVGILPPASGGPTPTSADRIVAAAAKLWVTRIDYLIITHYHDDHIGGIFDLADKIPIGILVDHGPNREKFVPRPPTRLAPDARHPISTYARYEALAASHERRIVKAGDRLDVGGLSFHVVAADGGVIDKPLIATRRPTAPCDTTLPRLPDNTENGRSVGLVATYGKARILALADVTWNLELALVCPTNLLGPVDLAIVSHHGAALSNSPPLFAATAPRVALLNNGARKGGDRASMVNLAVGSPKTVLWQLHSVPDQGSNRPADFIANPQEAGEGSYPLETQIYRSGAIKVTNARNGFSQTYGPRR